MNMRTVMLALAVAAPLTVWADAGPWTVSSPDGRCVMSVALDADGTASYQVLFGGKPALLKSPLGLRRDDQSFESGLAVLDAGKVEPRREAYELFAGPMPRVDHVLNHRSLVFRNTNNAQLTLDLAAGNEGVAFRYRFAGADEGIRVIQSERTGFAVSNGVRGWLQPYHGASDYTPAYEDFFFNVAPGEMPPRSRGKPIGWAFPALFQLPGADGWTLITESGTDPSYCACHLNPVSTGGVYRIDFPAADEKTKRQINRVGPEPRSSLPWTLPWRVIVLGKGAGDIATATLVTDVAAPSKLSDASWIRPGRASWAWWSHPDGPATAELFNEFTDFSARMGWEYTLFDAGWWGPGISGIASYARSNGVAPLAWCSASDFYDSTECNRRLDELNAAAVRGAKVDFWCSDRQEAIRAMFGLFEAAARRHMVVNLHGCTLPRGWQRTWPNFLAAEAVLGTESYFYESHYTEKAAELNTVLPFTRNAVGPMDVTPVACSAKKYVRMTTAAHELATALIATSGLIHFADQPEFFNSIPKEALQVLRDAPARWDETHCLVGEPGRVVVFARRHGKSWFLSGINGTDAGVPITLDLTPYHDFRQRTLIAEGAEPRMKVAATALANADSWAYQIPSRGGFIVRMDQ